MMLMQPGPLHCLTVLASVFPANSPIWGNGAVPKFSRYQLSLLQKALTKATVGVRSHRLQSPHISSPYRASIGEFLFRVSVVPASV